VSTRYVPYPAKKKTSGLRPRHQTDGKENGSYKGATGECRKCAEKGDKHPDKKHNQVGGVPENRWRLWGETRHSTARP